MKLGIMQPYFFPYIGYWQLLNLVDKYVIYDDVNYIKGGWINRNRILNSGAVQYLNVQMQGASPYKLINEVERSLDQVYINKTLKTLSNAYGKAPYFDVVFPMLENIFNSQENNLALFLTEAIKEICKYLDINTEIILSSEIEKDNSLKGADKVVHICQIMGASDYYNAIGGQELYDKDMFRENGIDLHFVETHSISYSQGNAQFQSNLSIIDVLMYNSKEEVKNMLEKYTLV